MKSGAGKPRRKRHLHSLPTILAPPVEGKGLGREQEDSALDCVRPYPDSLVALRTGPESQIGRLNDGAGRHQGHTRT